MIVAVSGANGFIGRSLCQHLENSGYRVVPLVRKVSEINGAKINFTFDELRVFLDGCDSAIHLAGYSQIPQSLPADESSKVNVGLTLDFARCAAEMGVKRFVFMSSAKVNGENTHNRKSFAACDTPAPTDSYAKSKAKAEEGLRQISLETGLDVVIIRPPLVYGPGVSGNFLSLIRLATLGVPLPLALMNARRSLVAIDNLVSFTTLCANPELSENAVGKTFLISDGVDYSVRTILEKIALAYGKKMFLFPAPKILLQTLAVISGKSKLLSRLINPMCLDIGMAQKILGWAPVVTLDEQLMKMAIASKDSIDP
jgi:nucleoside-diphosphate-sugar epimerase